MKKLDVVKKTVQILNSVSYENYSDEKTKTYLEYIEGSRADEDRLISPILLRKFLGAILGFELGKTIATQESKGIGKPDYIPVDTRTHPFVFDAKGTDTRHLSQHYPQIKKYVVSQELKYGILTNMRDLDVYTSKRGIEIEEYNFNFVQLYQDYKQNSITCLEEENTKRFLNFVESFSYNHLTKEKKIERIAKAKSWTGKEELNVKSLTDQLRHIVETLFKDVKEQKSELISMAEVGRVSAESIADEIEEIYAHISGREKAEVNAESFNKIMNAEESTHYGNARDAFFRRVAYFAMTRLLLARVWEDIGFIEQSLYNGGFAKWYKNFNHEIRRVLHYAFDLSADRYPWLFNVNNNYSWYEPSDDALVDSLYELSNFYLGKLDQDILGTIYEDYIESVDKKNKGQYYTPREIVSFIWDRVGFNNPKAFFWHINGKRKPNLIFDPAAGSGGFLVEAARRIREYPNFDWDEPQDLQDIHNTILWGIFGSEVSSFPYYLTQVNLLIQLTPVIRKHIELTGKKPRERPTPLGIICRDSLELHNPDPQRLSIEFEEEKEENRHEILHFTIAEKKIYEKIKEKRAGIFSYCCSNPPYVGEKGHKELFRHALKSYPYWSEYYQGKMDYLYWFIILGLSKLRNYGKLGFITSAYWPAADGASKLRKYILENAKIKEMIFFEGVKIFEHAKGQHNMVFVLTKCSGEDKQEERENNHIKIVQVKCKNQDLLGDTIRENLDFLTKHIQKHIDKSRYEDKYIKVFWSGVKQGELSKEGEAWNLIHTTRENKLLDKLDSEKFKLSDLVTIDEGIHTGADKVTNGNQRYLADPTLKKGTGIFILTSSEVASLGLSEMEKGLIKPWVKNSDINKYIVNLGDRNEFLIYTDDSTRIDSYPAIRNHLEKFETVLKLKREYKSGRRKWYALHWPRTKNLFEQIKIVVPYRAGENRFALDEQGLYGSADIFFIKTQTETPINVYYLLGLLNSKSLDFWCRKRLKKKGEVREYKPTLLQNLPIHKININDPEEVKLHDEVVEKVKAIRERMYELTKYVKYFSGPRLTKIEFDAALPEVNDETIIKRVASENLYNLRTHPEIKIEKPKGFEEVKFYLSKVDRPELTLTGNAQLKLIGKDKSVLFIMGPSELIRLVSDLLDNWKNKSWIEIKEKLLLPDNTGSFKAQKTWILNEVRDVREEISRLQEEIGQIVYKLYGLTTEEIKIVEGEENKRL